MEDRREAFDEPKGWPWPIWAAAGLIVLVVGVILAEAFSVSRTERAEATVPKKPARIAHRPVPQSSDAPHAQIIVEEDRHDFGFVDPWEDCHHAFVIRNVGEAPSTLQVASTTCVCTVGGLSSSTVYPGGKIRALVTVKPKVNEKFFSQSANVRTQDPDHEVVTLHVTGVVRKSIESSPPQLTLDDVHVGEHPVGEVLVFSQTWKGFEITKITPSRPGITCEVHPADAAALAALDARCGQRLTVTLPESPSACPISDRLVLSIQPDETIYRPQEYVIEIEGGVVGGISFDGPDLEFGKVIRLGQLRAGEGKRSTLTMKIREARRELQVKAIHTTPEFLAVKVVPYSADNPHLGLYRIEIEVPCNAPATNCMNTNPGKIRIETDHPDLPSVEFKVLFAVAGETEDRSP